jgi:uncharacterized protein YacL (UPF0231 family)
MRIDCYRDEDGNARTELEPRHGVLKSFLEEDVQESVSYCRAILNALAEVGEGRKSEWQQTGNAHALMILSDRVRIDPLFLEGEMDYELPVADFRAALNRWLAFITD